MYRIRRKTRLTVLLLTALVSHFTVERGFWQIPRTSARFDLTYSTYSDDQWYASFRVSKNTFQFLLLTRMWHTLNNWRGAPRAHKKRNRTVPKKGRAFTRWKENKNVGTEPFFIGSVPKGVHSRLWTFSGTERIQLERVKYRLDVEFCRSRSAFYPGRSNIFGRVNGPLVCVASVSARARWQCSRSKFRAITRGKTLATQASLFLKLHFQDRCRKVTSIWTVLALRQEKN